MKKEKELARDIRIRKGHCETSGHSERPHGERPELVFERHVEFRGRKHRKEGNSRQVKGQPVSGGGRRRAALGQAVGHWGASLPVLPSLSLSCHNVACM